MSSYNYAAARLEALTFNSKLTVGCQGCKHYCSNDGVCSYYLNTKKRRPCKPHPRGGCDAKDTGKKDSRLSPYESIY